MAKEFSFDIVSSIDVQEADNAFQQAKKALSQRYDLKDSGSEMDFDKQNLKITITAPSDFVIGQIKDILFSKLVKRGIELNAVSWSSPENATGGNVRVVGTFIDGIEKDIASNINKDIKAQKFKCKVQIEGNKLRVSAPSKDTLQDVIAFVKGNDYSLPLQFVNYR